MNDEPSVTMAGGAGPWNLPKGLRRVFYIRPNGSLGVRLSARGDRPREAPGSGGVAVQPSQAADPAEVPEADEPVEEPTPDAVRRRVLPPDTPV